MSEAEIETLRRRMADAIAAEDFEEAARLRDAIAGAGASLEPVPPTRIRRQVPGAMGLGTDQQVLSPPEGWTPPPPPDPGTANHRRGGRRRRS